MLYIDYCCINLRQFIEDWCKAIHQKWFAVLLMSKKVSYTGKTFGKGIIIIIIIMGVTGRFHLNMGLPLPPDSILQWWTVMYNWVKSSTFVPLQDLTMWLFWSTHCHYGFWFLSFFIIMAEPTQASYQYHFIDKLKSDFSSRFKFWWAISQNSITYPPLCFITIMHHTSHTYGIV